MTANLDQIEKTYQQIDSAVALLRSALNSDYLTALTETLSNLLQHQVHVENGAPNAETVADLEAKYAQIEWVSLSAAQRLELSQLLLFRRQQQDHPQANFQATPNAIGLLISLLLVTFMKQDTPALSIVDPTVGSGSLLFTLRQQLRFRVPEVRLVGLDNDDDLLALAAVLSEFLPSDLALMHQDALMPWLLDRAPDVVVADLPVGYYPVDSRAQAYDLHAKSGHSFAHFLLIEQSIKMLAPGGWGIFVVPANLFNSAGALDLLGWLTKHAYLQASLSLANTTFQNQQAEKALIVLQKHGDDAQQAKEVLIAKVPDLNKVTAVQHFSQELQGWARDNL
ncbi:class I SAM-dependent methyltransferase [Lapidilactobacillus achengensis]|uniref:Class I SAM-dependent methyltransferase n=1 Tax=Lapidilactobacillus achengensis TaxID=2486000 RepID=A0ABW1UNK2_9LACO|nr:class I SAM-dependent methyltransferase [Lapidilactobacillus achengensis]